MCITHLILSHIILSYLLLLVNSVVCRNTRHNDNVTRVSEQTTWTPGRVVARININGQHTVFRVVNGRPGQLQDVPYQIAFRVQVKRSEIFGTFCGGTIIAAKRIVTAAHCFHRKGTFDSCCHKGHAPADTLEGKYAVAGTIKNFVYKNSDEIKSQWRTIKSATYPKTYAFPTDDVSIVTLNYPFEFDEYVNMIPYARLNKDYSGTCLVSGYGRIGPTKQSDRLRLADLRMLSYKQCHKLHSRDMSKFICTSDAVSDIGKGDSGGPLVCKGTGDPRESSSMGILVGIVSGKRFSGHGSGGSFFIRVSSYVDFIANKGNFKRCVPFFIYLLLLIYFCVL